jgi:hypothetical protein
MMKRIYWDSPEGKEIMLAQMVEFRDDIAKALCRHSGREWDTCGALQGIYREYADKIVATREAREAAFNVNAVG